MNDRDAFFMRQALQLAERGRGRTSPNPMVGALVVDPEGVIVGRGAHEAAGAERALHLSFRSPLRRLERAHHVVKEA